LVSLAVGAALADVSVRTLRRYIAQGRLTCYRVGSSLVKVDLNGWSNSHGSSQPRVPVR
jgi:hypothetical protein